MVNREEHPEMNARQLRNLAVNTVVRNVLVFAISSSIMFLAAGRLDWPEAIIFWITYFLISLASSLYLLKIDSGLMKERQDAISQKNVKPWDRWILVINMFLTTGLFALIGLDAGRFGWTQVPILIRIAGGILNLLSFGLTLWASHTNTYMSSLMRIQSERGQHVISSGPYAFIRHPMYAGMCLLDLGMPLLLNSWFGLTVSGLMIATIFIRTSLEDKTLQAELQSYTDYATRVKYRLVPGIW
jgi:protein-S-isoprenylcysteine O-methyltransferase Ste14